jgi:hypothetical protein
MLASSLHSFGMHGELRNFEHVENDFGTAMARKWDIGSAADQL